MNMETESPDAVAASPAAITKRTAELIVGALLLAFGLLAIVSNYQLGAGWADDGPQAGYFPLRMGVAVFIASVVVVIQALRKNDRSAFVERAQLKLVLTVLLPLVVYIAAIQVTGIYVASALFIGIFMVLVGRFTWWRSTAVGVGMMAAFFWIFETLFKVPLPKGPLERWFGY